MAHCIKNKNVCMNLVKLTAKELQKIAKGELTYIEHPEKGIMYVDYNNVFVNTYTIPKKHK